MTDGGERAVTDAARGHDTPAKDALALYSLAVEMSDHLTQRRATANSFFFSMQAGLAVALGAFAIRTGDTAHPKPDRFELCLAALAGAVLAASWWLLLRSYRDLSRAKFEVILRMEREHLDLHIYGEEWQELKKNPIKSWRGRYAEQGQVERVVPLLFLLIYLVLAVHVLVG